MFLLEPLKSHDVNFFIICGASIALIAIIWLLIPVFNKRQYKDQRDSLRKREIAFKSNLKQSSQTNPTGLEQKSNEDTNE